MSELTDAAPPWVYSKDGKRLRVELLLSGRWAVVAYVLDAYRGRRHPGSATRSELKPDHESRVAAERHLAQVKASKP